MKLVEMKRILPSLHPFLGEITSKGTELKNKPHGTSEEKFCKIEVRDNAVNGN